MNDLFEKLVNNNFNEYKKHLTGLMTNNEKRFIVTANPEAFVIAFDDKSFYNLLMNKNVEVVADGIGLVKASRFFKNRIKERLPGVEIVEYLFEECNRLEKSIYLFGSKEQVLLKLIKRLECKYPKIKILGFKNGYDYDRDEIFKEIKELKPDLCLVALGMPSQEKLIYKYYNDFSKGIFIGVGGTFDVLSGEKNRAPKIFLKLNLEWLYRLLKDPKRFKRFYKYNVRFLKLIFRKEK